MKFYLKGIKNKCRCGAVADCIKKVYYNAKGQEKEVYIIRAVCKKCGLDFTHKTENIL